MSPTAYVTYGDCLMTAAAVALELCSGNADGSGKFGISLTTDRAAYLVGRKEVDRADPDGLAPVQGTIDELKKLQIHATIFTQLG
jgi:hypothetical protein